MTHKQSAGLLMFRRSAGRLEVLLAHPGGPYWRNKDLGAWTVPKGERAESEAALEAAQREFAEETGLRPIGPYLALGSMKQRSGKQVTAWAFEGDCDPGTLASNTFELEWPPGSGKIASYPEIDRAAWFSPDEARRRILSSQRGFIDVLVALLKTR